MSSRRTAVLTAAFLCLASAVLASGCSLFDPRDPEDPGEDPYSFYQLPTSPQIVMSNMDGSLQALAMALYMGCMDTSFVFVADPADVDEFGAGGSGGGTYEFDGWDHDAEEATIGTLFAQVSSGSLPPESLIVVSFMSVTGYPDPPAPIDSAVIYREYSIGVAGSGYAEWDSPAVGWAKITLVEDDSAIWTICRWEDYRLEESTDEMYTWGVTKASYR
jgi:hypothetical protein